MSGNEYRRVAAYLESLPNGLDSYPECKARATGYRTALRLRPIPEEALAGLPARVAQHVRAPLGNTAWVPEVEDMAVQLAIGDHYQLDDPAYLAWMYQLNRELLGGPIFRALLAMVPIEILLKGAAMRWTKFHLGAKVTPTMEGRDGGTLSFEFPSRLYTKLLLEGFATAFQAALELSASGKGRVWLLRHDETSAQFQFKIG